MVTYRTSARSNGGSADELDRQREDGRPEEKWRSTRVSGRSPSRFYWTREGLARHSAAGNGRDAATTWCCYSARISALSFASRRGEDQGIGVAVNGFRRWSSKVARRRGERPCLGVQHARLGVEDDPLPRRGKLGRGPGGLGLGQVGSLFSVSFFSIFCFAVF
jgi:hypothetical protein